ncbi:MAG TPA: aminotransferase class I/II-fold pyridoxal phosphate-dependent enzyme, partial [Motiliproteus sp.]
MFEHISRLPNDPILGLSAAYREDQNPLKVDLGVGVYKTATGETPVLACVKQAEQWLLENEPSKSYIAPVGNADFVSGMSRLIMGEGALLAAGRVATAQAPGGTGALRVGAEFVKRCNSNATVWISSPTWANHIPLFGEAGLTVKEYPYFDAATSSVDFTAMRAALEQMGPNDVVLLHGCFHNPSGADLSAEQWEEVALLAKARGFMPFIDLAYLGFGDGLVEDAVGVRT